MSSASSWYCNYSVKRENIAMYSWISIYIYDSFQKVHLNVPKFAEFMRFTVCFPIWISRQVNNLLNLVIPCAFCESWSYPWNDKQFLHIRSIWYNCYFIPWASCSLKYVLLPLRYEANQSLTLQTFVTLKNNIWPKKCKKYGCSGVFRCLDAAKNSFALFLFLNKNKETIGLKL